MRIVTGLLAVVLCLSANAETPFKSEDCATFLVGPWAMENPRLYTSDGRHLGGEAWMTDFKADGTFEARVPGDHAVSRGAWTTKPGAAAGACAISMVFAADAPAAPVTNTAESEWMVESDNHLRRTKPAEAFAERYEGD